MPSRNHLVVMLAAGLAACHAESRAAAGFPVRTGDSAGVRIAEYTGTPAAGAPFRFPAGPRYRRGANPGGCAFRGIRPGSLFPDGSAVVSDVFDEEPVVASQDGTTHELPAGPGEGPGDASYVGAVFALGQETGFWQPTANWAVRPYFAGGSVERTVDIRRAGGLGVLGIGSSGQLLMATNSFMPGFEEDWLPGHMARCDMDTGALDTVASYDLSSRPPPGLRRSPAGAGGMVTSRLRPVRLRAYRQAGGHPAPARRHRDADRALAGRAGTPWPGSCPGGIRAGLRAGNQDGQPGSAGMPSPSA